MADTASLGRPDEVANKVMRRIHVSKMTRTLQDRLALANVKIQNGWEHIPLALIEPQVEERLKSRKRPSSSNDTISDTASTTSSRIPSSSAVSSSPLTAPMFSDDLLRSGSFQSNKRMRPARISTVPTSGPATGRRQRLARHGSWKRDNRLPESSPIDHARHVRLPSNNVSHLSFISESPTIPDSPPSPIHSEDDDTDLPIHSSMNNSAQITSSPPRTPPPDRRMRKNHTSNVSWSRTPKTGEGDADLLLYLATSPSPANASNTRTLVPAPSTPPPNATPLPPSHMTPGFNSASILGFGPYTPGTNFNFADYVNVTPSPAQTHWTRTPAASREARRKLNFDNLATPSASTATLRGGSNVSRGDGLGMELGGDLLS